MNNYNIKNKNTQLNISSSNDLSESFGNELPYPQNHIKTNYYIYSWIIEGYFHTTKNLQYLNDIVARLMITFPKDNVQKINHIYVDKNENTPLKLKHFQQLKSIKSRILNYEKTQKVNCEDQVFWALKLYFEQMIEDNNLSYDHFENFAFNNFVNRTKDRSTLKAKCRSIYNYYVEKDFKINCKYVRKYNDKELKMTRIENMKKVNEQQKQKNKELIDNILNSLLRNEYLNKNNTYNISKIARDTNLSRNTVYKYLNEKSLV